MTRFLPMATLKFEKFQSPGKGNGLRAVVPLYPGDLLYATEPFVYTVCKSVFDGSQVCDFCLRLPDRLLRCSGCKFVKYCGLRCQKEAWSDHYKECRCLKSIHPREPTKMVQLIGRAIFKILKNVPCPSEQLYTMSELQSNLTKITDDTREGLCQLALTLKQYLKVEIMDMSHLPSSLNILELFAKAACNAFSICNSEMQDIGAGLYPSMSLMNHNCDPNCVIVFEGKTLLLRASRKIQMGEELTISYIDTMMQSSDRQRQLNAQYSFQCDCYRCQTQDKDELMVAGEKQAVEETQKAKARAQRLQLEGKWEQSLALCQVILNSNIGRLTDLNIHQVAMLDCAMDACIRIGLFQEAFLYGRRTLEAYRLYRSNICPVKAIQLMRVGKLQHLHDKVSESQLTMKEAYDILKITHGRNHRLTLELMEFL